MQSKIPEGQTLDCRAALHLQLALIEMSRTPEVRAEQIQCVVQAPVWHFINTLV